METKNFIEAKEIFSKISSLEHKYNYIKRLLSYKDLSCSISGYPIRDPEATGILSFSRKEEPYVSENRSYLLMLLNNDLELITDQIAELKNKFNIL